MAIITPDQELKIRGIVEKLNNKSLADIARENKIFFTESDLSTIGKGISGLIMYRQDRNEFGIFIEETDHPNRKRFTFAHELGHYFLHKDELKKGIGYFVDNEETFALFRACITRNIEDIQDAEEKEKIKKRKIMESEANCFAAELLMPKSLVEEAYPKLNYNIKELASFFRVSEQAMTFRLFNLSLLANQ